MSDTSDTWKDLQALKCRQSSLRERLQRRKKERQEIVMGIAAGDPSSPRSNSPTPNAEPAVTAKRPRSPTDGGEEEERQLLLCLLDVALALPTDSRRLQSSVSRALGRDVELEGLQSLLNKFSAQELIGLRPWTTPEGTPCLQVQEFCAHGTRDECRRASSGDMACTRLHFRKILQKHTDESLGDCSFLNTCFHMDTCKYVHYEVEQPAIQPPMEIRGPGAEGAATVLQPPQWIQCDLRYFDMSILGQFAVVMADPPWDIHMELPYGTMSDDEMRQLNVPSLTQDGLIFLWVTGRAMELGRECLRLWGYQRCDEIIWVKTNQLQRIIRTGRTGHWLNHGKEHCLVGIKGNPKDINRGLDCDVIVAEVRATSHKPDEIYGIIERLSPGTRKIELFGRPHNVQPNWITLGNQVDGVRLTDPDLIREFRKLYPDGDCMKKPT
ncbi:N6-adenosine-methyltransferase subunit METTL3-like isoform X2 [Ornithodoros turicata]|uniref:N6-adenosine-methyltransferase subunit METTL3-like isoform X2 n=1 Tax=Ornithodoros turicata TaxID=34597 RepID=UPI0031397DC0